MAILEKIDFNSEGCYVFSEDSFCRIHFPDIKIGTSDDELRVLIRSCDKTNTIVVEIEFLAIFKIDLDSNKVSLLHNKAKSIEFLPGHADLSRNIIDIRGIGHTTTISYMKKSGTLIMCLNGDTESIDKYGNKYYVEAVFNISETKEE